MNIIVQNSTTGEKEPFDMNKLVKSVTNIFELTGKHVVPDEFINDINEKLKERCTKLGESDIIWSEEISGWVLSALLKLNYTDVYSRWIKFNKRCF